MSKQLNGLAQQLNEQSLALQELRQERSLIIGEVHSLSALIRSHLLTEKRLQHDAIR
jgi:hypothetical protein